MPTITRLKAGKRDPTRVNIFVDEKFAFSLSAEEVITRHLKVGQEIENTHLDNLRSTSQEEKLFAKIINFLSYRPRSVKEVKDRLAKYLIGNENKDSIVESMTQRLLKLGYLDDEKFAEWFVESRNNHRPRSRRELSNELYKKGIPRDISRSVINKMAKDEDAINELIDKKKNLDKDKLMSYLARRGFSYDLIKSALASRLEELTND